MQNLYLVLYQIYHKYSSPVAFTNFRDIWKHVCFNVSVFDIFFWSLKQKPAKIKRVHKKVPEFIMHLETITPPDSKNHCPPMYTNKHSSKKV